MTFNYLPIFNTEKVTVLKGGSVDNGKSIVEDAVCLATWTMCDKKLTFYLDAFRWAYGNKPTYPLYRKVINTLTHEVLHGVIHKVMEQDRYSGSFNQEWPMLKGMDNDYKRMMKRLNG